MRGSAVAATAMREMRGRMGKHVRLCGSLCGAGGARRTRKLVLCEHLVEAVRFPPSEGRQMMRMDCYGARDVRPWAQGACVLTSPNGISGFIHRYPLTLRLWFVTMGTQAPATARWRTAPRAARMRQQIAVDIEKTRGM